MKKYLSDNKIKQIKKRLIDLDITQAELAKELNVTPMAVCYVINGRRKSDKIRKYLEKRLGIKISPHTCKNKASEIPTTPINKAGMRRINDKIGD